MKKAVPMQIDNQSMLNLNQPYCLALVLHPKIAIS